MPRLGRALAALAAGCVLAAIAPQAMAAPPAGADDLYREARTLQASYAAEIGKLAEWCRQQGLTAEERQTRAARGPQDPYKLFLPILPQAAGPPPGPPEDAPAGVAQWAGRLLKLRQEQAAALYDLARRAIRRRQPSLAYQCAVEAIGRDPDHEGLRRVFGYQKYRNQWHTAYEVKKLSAGMVWHDKFGWIRQSNVERYEQGQRLANGRWIAADAEARLHATIQAGWEIESEHYLIRTNDGIESAVALAEKLEGLNRLWQQMFIRYYASEAYVDALFSGKGQAPRSQPPRFDVVYFHTRDEYNRALVREMPDIGVSTGIYISHSRTAYFFAGGDDTQRVMYHEATHQLFQQSRRVPPDIGRRANFWLVEGIAMYMESLHRQNGYHVLGGLDDVRMTAARYHLFQQNFYVPFAALCRLGMSQLQAQDNLAKLYSQMAAMTHFLVHYDGGRYRDALVACLAAIYSDNQDPNVLAELTGTSYAELDRQYHEYMQLGQPPSRPSPE
ncbi:MAG: hypothetical protein ABSF26_31365 [Thermoguttaceae bacterium]